MKQFDISPEKFGDLQNVSVSLNVGAVRPGSGPAVNISPCWCGGNCEANCGGACMGVNLMLVPNGG